MANRRSGRRIAVQAVYSHDLGGHGVDELLRLDWIDSDAPARQDLDFPRLLIRGTLDNLPKVDAAIKEQLANWDFSRVNRVDLAILRVSVYCLLYQPAIPASVTIDEAVELAKVLSAEQSYRFVNGVLDGIHRKTRPPDTEQ